MNSKVGFIKMLNEIDLSVQNGRYVDIRIQL